MVFLGEGSFGQVIKAKNKSTGQIVAIKYIKDIFRSQSYEWCKVIREIQILRHLTEMQNNIFTPKLIDIIIPQNVATVDNEGFQDVFMVMECFNMNLGQLPAKVAKGTFKEQNVLVILYNMLCAIKYLHSANVIHRDLKPANILMTPQCNIYVCDFGLARTMPREDKIDEL